ncbi:MAG: hypothetical protein ABI766_07490 [Gemmatimonadales bacterium]
MSGSYKECAECGKRALSVATRCPQCGHEFPHGPPTHTDRAPDFRRYLPGLAVLGAAAVMIMLVVAVFGRTRGAPPDASTAAITRPDTIMATESMPASSGERRFARTWTKVRTGRTVTADVAAVLLPGDTVIVDSLSRGWWRVALEGKVLGYAHRSTLMDKPPPAAR